VLKAGDTMSGTLTAPTLASAGAVQSGGGLGPSIWYDGSANNYLSMLTGGTTSWAWQVNRSTGALRWLNSSSNAVFTLDGNGNSLIGGGLSIVGTVFSVGVNSFGLVDTGPSRFLKFSNDNWRLEFNPASGSLTYMSSTNSPRFIADASGNFTIAANGFKPAGGPWADSSDARIKQNVQEYTRGLDAVLALRPVTYNFTAETDRDTSVVYHGLIAQEAKVPMPEMVTIGKKTVGRAAYDDMHTLDTGALVYALVNAVKTLHARVADLEALAATGGADAAL
jgi:hypothetical protein